MKGGLRGLSTSTAEATEEAISKSRCSAVMRPVGIVGQRQLPGQVPRLEGVGARMGSDMQGGPIDELLGVAVERPGLDQLEVEVGRTLEDRGQPGLTGDSREANVQRCIAACCK